MSFEIIENYEEYLRSKTQAYVDVTIDEGGRVKFRTQDVREEWDYEPEIPDYEGYMPADKVGDVTGILPSTFVEFAVRMPDKVANTYVPFSFEGRRYLRQIYDTGSKRTLLKCGRQVEKSTLLGNKLLSYSCIVQALNCLYISPTNMQTKVFSQDRLKEPIETSEYMKSWTTTKLSDNIFLKKFINRSQITLRYCYMSADRVRGIPADIICIDELQDILTDNIPVIEQCSSHSPYKIFMYSGTPKSLDNTIEYYWTEFSTQNEWMVPCHRHSIMAGNGKMSKVYWNMLREDNIGKKSLICDRCKNEIVSDDPESQWVSMNPGIVHRIPKPYEGFRIPQIMVPWIPWSDILQNQLTYPRAKFHNEVLGMSYDSGTRPLTRKDVMDNCDPNIRLDEAFQAKIKAHIAGTFPVYVGIDWGTGENTYTVMAFGTYLQDRFTIFRIIRFEGRESEPDVMIDNIMRDIESYQVRRVGCDYGGGFWPNDRLLGRFGWERIAKYQYATIGEKVKWDDGFKRFMVNRTEVMSDVFNAIKKRTVFRFPDWDQFSAPFGSDMLNIFSEYNEQRRENVYKKSPSSTDDSFHAITLCFLISMLDRPRPDVIAPMRDHRTSD